MTAPTCPSCAAPCPEEAHFCPACGAELATDRPPCEQRERKVVTCLFCDLVGFTALSESADPEDIDRLLRDYARVAAHAVEIYGGVVEKFIGDAVVAVFGVPAAHEDDAERAVHAALRIIEDVTPLRAPDGSAVRVRIGLNTGEAVARLDTSSRSGEGFLAGDAVNTAARLQTAAPIGEVLVGPTTYALTSRLFHYSERDPLDLRGKAEPVPVWAVKGPVARTGADRTTDFATTFVGRGRELRRLTDALQHAIRESRTELMFVSGEPGIGKSRLVAELYGWIDRQSRTISWRQGRCLPYGEDVSFWPLRDVVKAQAGILDNDTADEVEGKLDRALSAGPDKAWILSRVRPLVGLEAPAASQEENFAAWVRLLEQLALRRPLVLVIEDLHWADDAMLAFLRALIRARPKVPLLLLLTARTQFADTGAAFLELLAPHELVKLRPLTPSNTTRLLVALLNGVLVVLSDNVIKPLVMKNGVEMHTALIFLSLLGGIAAFGLIGIIIGPLAVSLLLAILRMYRRDYAPASAPPPVNTIERA